MISQSQFITDGLERGETGMNTEEFRALLHTLLESSGISTEAGKSV